MPPKGKSKRTPTKGKGRGRKKAVVPSPQPRRLIPIDESENIFYIPECPNTQSDRNKMSVGLGKSHLLRLR